MAATYSFLPFKGWHSSHTILMLLHYSASGAGAAAVLACWLPAEDHDEPLPPPHHTLNNPSFPSGLPENRSKLPPNPFQVAFHPVTHLFAKDIAMNILVLGGSGFIGSRLVRTLQNQGCRVRTPRRSEIDFLNPDPARAAECLRGIDAVINAVGIMSRHADLLETVHHRTPARLARLAAEAGVRRWVQLSALGARPDHPVAFLGSKGRGDEAVQNSGLSVGTARPSVVFGRGGASCEVFIKLARLPVLALPQRGGFLLQPVHVDDVAEGLAALARSTGMQTVAFTGSSRCTLAGYLNILRRNLHGKADARILNVPRTLAECAAALAKLPSNGMVSRDSLKLLDEGSTADCTDFAGLLGRPPLAAGVFGLPPQS